VTRVGFIIEQALGHITHTRNLQAHVPLDPTIDARWGLIPFEATGAGAAIPLFNSNWTVRAGLRARRSVRRLTRVSPLDALFFHTQVTAILAADWVRAIPSVVSLDATPRQYDALGAAYDHAPGPDWLEAIKWRLNRNCFRAARHLVTWSEWAKAGLVDEYEVPADKITVIPPGVTVSDWCAPERRRDTTTPLRLLFVGGNLERKGGRVLLEAWRRVSSRRAEGAVPVELHLVTKDRVPAQLGLHVYNAMQPNDPALRQLYFDSDVFCLPTYGDCLPMVLSEAAAAGLPAISTHVAAIPEITRHEETGLIVPPGDVDAMVAALELLLEHPDRRRRMGAAAATFVAQQFDAARNAQRLLDVLKDVAGGR
jgi:glycosyltransferase involved in cell wall biosynthesis